MSGVITPLEQGGSPLERKESFRSGFLQCGICFSPFEDPKFLPCVHTFCKECLAGHIRVACSRANPRFNCPTCRERIEIPNPHAPREQWAGQFRSNFLINNLMGIVAGGGVEGANIQTTLEGRSCYRHPSKPLDLLCVDHDLLICSSCAPTLHRACLQVITLEEAVDEKRDSIRRFEHVFSEHLSRAQIMLAEQKKEKDNLFHMYTQERQKIAQYANAIINEIKVHTNKSLEDLDMAFQMHASELDVVIEDYNGRVRFLKRLKDTTRSMNAGTDPMNAIEQFSTLEKYSVKLSSYKEKNSTEIQVRGLRFEESNITPTPLGEIKTSASVREILLLPFSTPPPSPTTSQDQPRSPSCPSDVSPFHELVTGERTLVLDRIIFSKIRSDKNHPNLRDAVCVPGGVLVVTDDQNICVKSFYTHGTKEMHSKLVMEKKPHALCNYVGNMVAVTVPKAKHVAIISVTPNLILQQTIKTNHRYWGIAAVGTDAFVVSTCPGTGEVDIHIIDQEGKILRCVHSGKYLIANPLYLCTLSSGDIIVSDCTVPKVVCLRQNGHVIYTCEPTASFPLKKPMGMADTGRDYFLLGDMRSTLAVVDYSGKIQYAMRKVDGISEPKGVAIGPKGTVFIANENGKIAVFALQRTGPSPDSTIPKEFATVPQTRRDGPTSGLHYI